MSESCLSQKISLCRCIETLNDDGCYQVIRLLQHSQKFESLNQFLTQIVFKATDTLNAESLQHINNGIKQITSNKKYIRTEQSVDNKSIQSKQHSASDSDENVAIFPLFPLPIDTIKNTSLFLNEKDIFQFEKCCRLFYQMINNLSYLKQTNNFKTFTMNDKRWDQIIESKIYSFYKYSQANTMNVRFRTVGFGRSFGHGRDTNKSVTKFVNKKQSQWEQMKCMDKEYDHWLSNLFKSIKSLKLCENSTLALLNKLPMDVLFDPQSQFETFEMNHYWNGRRATVTHLQSAIDEFEREYLELKEKYAQQGKKMKTLKLLDYISSRANDKLTGPRFIETEHLVLYNILNNFAAKHLFSRIRVLTCIGTFDIQELDQIDCNIAIDTLRLIDFTPCFNNQICTNDKFIKTLNLHRNLVNLTIDINMAKWCTGVHDKMSCIECIETILCKQYYYNLNNVNILIQICEEDIEFLFEMLKENISILKYQFKQLNIGLQIVYHAGKYCTFKWNPQIDENFLDKQKQQMKGEQSKYIQWLRQWTK